MVYVLVKVPAQEVLSMEKISRILAPNPRTKAVDVASSQPGRPGAPAMGRPQMAIGRPVEDQISLSTAEKAVENTPLYKNTKENARAKIVDDLAKKFFESAPIKSIRSDEGTKSEQLADVSIDRDLPISTEAS